MKKNTLVVFFILTVVLAFGLIRSGKLLTIFPVTNMKLISPAFAEGSVIPEKFTCKGENNSPPLEISEVPSGTKSFVLILEDPDAPFQTWDHWLLWNIAPGTLSIPENSTPASAISGTTSFGSQKYGGPCPPSGTHHYIFKLIALDTTLTLPPEAHKADLEEVIKGHILGEARLTGTFP